MKEKDKTKKIVVLSDRVRYTESMSLPLTNDVIFKYVFGAKESERVLLALVNAVLTDYGFEPAVSLSIKNPIILKDVNWIKGSVLDIRAKDSNGAEYDIEMQVSEERNFKNRSLFYWARQYSSQLESGEEYGELKPVICINLVDFLLTESPDVFHTCFVATEKKRQDLLLTNDFQIHFVELPKAGSFAGKLAEWARFLVATDCQSEDVMKTLLENDEDFAEAYDRYKKCLRDRRAYQDAISRQMWQLDQNSRRKDAERAGRAEGLAEGRLEGKAEGLQQGLEEGLQQGLEQGLQQGLEQGVITGVKQGVLQAKYDMAKKLSAVGKMTYDEIADITGITVEEVESLVKV